ECRFPLSIFATNRFSFYSTATHLPRAHRHKAELRIFTQSGGNTTLSTNLRISAELDVSIFSHSSGSPKRSISSRAKGWRHDESSPKSCVRNPYLDQISEQSGSRRRRKTGRIAWPLVMSGGNGTPKRRKTLSWRFVAGSFLQLPSIALALELSAGELFGRL